MSSANSIVLELATTQHICLPNSLIVPSLAWMQTICLMTVMVSLTDTELTVTLRTNCVMNLEPLPSTIQFQGRWVLEGSHRCATWCGSSVNFRTMSRSIILELGDLTTFRESKPDHPNILWNFGSASEPHLEHVKGRSTLILEAEGGANADIHKNSEVLRDVTVMLCDWGASLHILNIYTVRTLSPNSIL